MANQILENNCRICWIEDNDDEMLSVFHEVEGYDESLAKMIEFCGGIQITENSELSKVICQNCTRELLVAMKFKRKCVKSIEFLESLQAQFDNDEMEELNGADDNVGDKLSMQTELPVMLVEMPTETDNKENDVLNNKLYNLIQLDNIKLEDGSLDDTGISYEITTVNQDNVHELFQNDRTITQSEVMQIPTEGYEDVEYLEGDNEVEFLIFDSNSNQTKDDDSCSNLTNVTDDSKLKEDVVLPHTEKGQTTERRRRKKFITETVSTAKVSANINHSCEVCGAGFTHMINLKRHLMSVHNLEANTLHTCPICSIIYSSYKEFSSHVDSHGVLPQKSVQSNENPGTAAPADDLEVLFDEDFHNNLRKPFKCVTCKKAFSTNSALVSHIRTHTGEKPFSCKVCTKTFTTLGGLDLHQRRHTGFKPFKCDFCNRRFVETSNLKVHMRTHTGEKPHVCIICGKGFSRVFLLQLHLRTHTGEKPYTCPICTKSFAQLCDLSAHKKIHTGERPHRCDICGKGFIKSSGLHAHMRRHTKIGDGKVKDFIRKSMDQIEIMCDDGENNEDDENADSIIKEAKYIITCLNDDNMIVEEDI